MSNHELLASSIAILLTALSTAAGMPPLREAPPSAAQHEDYALVAAPEYFGRYAEEYAGVEGADEGVVKRNLDQIGGGHLLRSSRSRQGAPLSRNLDHIGGGNLLRSTSERRFYAMPPTERFGGGRVEYSSSAERKEEARSERNLDHIGGGHLLRDLRPLRSTAKRADEPRFGADERLRNLDHIGGGNLVRSVEEYAGGYPPNSRSPDA
ncbi:hypothetical protein KM043_001793 [Ampulex compressa]|nr:hypothetical protein KM043_001793 [Ampulex compressa]